jgi:hypothetical protein
MKKLLKKDFSEFMSQSQIKANTGKNQQYALYSNIGAVKKFSECKTVNEKINRKSFYANPQKYYEFLKQFELL